MTWTCRYCEGPLDLIAVTEGDPLCEDCRSGAAQQCSEQDVYDTLQATP